MAAAMSAEQYLGTAQHAVLARLSQALANVPATQPKDKQLAGVAGMLGLPAPRVGGHELFEETLSRMVLDYASTAMTQARVDARAVHAGDTTWPTVTDRLKTHPNAIQEHTPTMDRDYILVEDDDTPDAARLAATHTTEPWPKKQRKSYGEPWTIELKTKVDDFISRKAFDELCVYINGFAIRPNGVNRNLNSAEFSNVLVNILKPHGFICRTEHRNSFYKKAFIRPCGQPYTEQMLRDKCV